MDKFKNFTLQYSGILIPLIFLMGIVIPFNGYWLSGIFYFLISWIGFIAFIYSFQLTYINSIESTSVLLAHSIPIFTFFVLYYTLFYQYINNKLIKYFLIFFTLLNTISFTLYFVYSIKDLIHHNFSFTFFNHLLWFISSLLCLYHSLKKNDIIKQKENNHELCKISSN